MNNSFLICNSSTWLIVSHLRHTGNSHFKMYILMEWKYFESCGKEFIKTNTSFLTKIKIIFLISLLAEDRHYSFSTRYLSDTSGNGWCSYGGTLLSSGCLQSLSISDIKRRPSLDPQGCVDSVYLACWSSSMVWALGLRRWEPVRPSKINL